MGLRLSMRCECEISVRTNSNAKTCLLNDVSLFNHHKIKNARQNIMTVTFLILEYLSVCLILLGDFPILENVRMF